MQARAECTVRRGLWSERQPRVDLRQNPDHVILICQLFLEIFIYESWNQKSNDRELHVTKFLNLFALLHLLLVWLLGLALELLIIAFGHLPLLIYFIIIFFF